jgi:hypothetical protein
MVGILLEECLKLGVVGTTRQYSEPVSDLLRVIHWSDFFLALAGGIAELCCR